MKTKAWEDPIVAEVRKVKEQLAAKFNYDVAAMLQDAQKRERRIGAQTGFSPETESQVGTREVNPR